MAIDYVLDLHCQAKDRLGQDSRGTNRLVELNRTRIIARAALQLAREQGDQRPPEDLAVQAAVVAIPGVPELSSARPVTTIAALLAQSAELEPLAEHCHHCPAGDAREFGCHRRIAYPIAEDAEAWLMSRLPPSLECTAGALLMRAIRELGWDGAPVARMRTAGFFESRAPYGVRWRRDDQLLEVSSDQIFQMMFLVGDLEPSHALMVALVLGVVPHDTELATLKDPLQRDALLTRAELAPQGSPEVEQLAGFLRAARDAARLDVKLRVEV
jgi:hypothetical protein